MALFLKIDIATREVVNKEKWATAPTEVGYEYVQADADVGDLYSVDGQFVKPAKELVLVTLEELQSKRDDLLSKSDFTQLPDSPYTDEEKLVWATYRQALRDMTEDYVPVESPEWPTL